MNTEWPSVKAKYLLVRQNHPVTEEDGTVTAFRDGEVILRSERRIFGFTEAEKFLGYQAVNPGELVIHSMDAFAGAIGISKSRGKMSPVAHIYSGGPDVDLRFYSYFLRHLANNGYIQSLAKGIRERSTAFDPAMLAQLELPKPPITVQKKIADYLDETVPKIGDIIDLYSHQLRLANEYFGEMVENLTSVKLNPKDEGISLRRVCRIDPETLVPDNIEQEVTFLGLEDVQPGNHANFNRVRNVKEVLSGYSRFKSGDVLVPKVSPSFGHGRAVVARNLKSSVGFASTEIFTVRSRCPEDNEYICQSMRARDFLMNGESSYQGVAGVKRVDKEVVLAWRIRWPEKNLRIEIVRSINEAQHHLEILKKNTEEAIKCLVELRTGLIQNAILGVSATDD
jgi:type I restriction enzyme S subunit